MTDFPPALTCLAVPEFPRIYPGDDLAEIALDCLQNWGFEALDYDVFVLSQKIVSKAQNRYVQLSSVTPSPAAEELASATQKDPRLVEVILSQSRRVLKYRPGLIVTIHRLGFVMANAGVDRSNLGVEDDESVLLLPDDPDGVSADLKRRLDDKLRVETGVIICDSVGRPWRSGTVGVALGCAGVPAVRDLRGESDMDGRTLQVSEVGYADQASAAASLVMGEAAEGRPLVVVRGLSWSEPGDSIQRSLRPAEHDLFK